MKALIFAAGLGTRLRPLTDSLPKALVPVGGEPLLHRVICKLRAAGYDELVVNVHHFSSLIVDYLGSHDFGIPVRVSDESALLRETGGGIAFARGLLEPLQEPFLVHNVDILSNLDLAWLREQTRPEALATLVVSDRTTSRYLLFGEDMRLKGWTNVNTGEVRSPYPETELKDCRRLAFSGIHNLSPAIFDAFMKADMPERFPIMDFYIQACGDQPIYGVVPEYFRMVDVGKLDTLAAAEEFISSNGR